MKLGFIGTGRISTAVIESLARDSYEIFISRRGKKTQKDYQRLMKMSSLGIISK